MQKKTIWRCPSNIAIVKYWGKRENQIPANSSISMTLSNSYTEIELELHEKREANIELEYFFEGKKNPAFEERILHYLIGNQNILPVLSKHSLVVHSRNSFPHSAGIASSASAFGAIALSLLDASFPEKHEDEPKNFYKIASKLARLGSGSASRSMFSPYSLWGKNELIVGSTDEFAIELAGVHQNFQEVHDSILIVDETPKKVSSSLGHSLMNAHEYANQRFAQANRRTGEIVKILANGDWESFIRITESEALTLHAMMMSSPNPYLLMKPGTLLAIENIQKLRKDKKLPICFTLDAGPNVHVLYPSEVKDQVIPFLNELMGVNSSKIIHDITGKGPEKLQ